MVKRILMAAMASLFAVFASGQIINKDKIKLSNFVERLYRNGPFTGVKVIDDEDAKYLLSVVALESAKYEGKGGESTMDKIAPVKATNQASKFFNGSSVSAETVIHTTENADGSSDVDVMEKISESSMGYVKSLELLSTFYDEKGQKVYVYSKTIEDEVGRKSKK